MEIRLTKFFFYHQFEGQRIWENINKNKPKKKLQNYTISRIAHLMENANRTRDAPTLSASALWQAAALG